MENFHKDKTPSMQVYEQTGTVYCFSSNCPTHGKALDQIDFILYKEKISKAAAIKKAQSLLGEIPTTKIQTTIPTKKMDALTRTAVLTKMFSYFKNAVTNSKPAQDYIKSRGLDPIKVEIGYNTAQFHHGNRKDEALINSCVEVGLLAPWGVNSRVGGQAVSGMVISSLTIDASSKFYTKANSNLIVSGAVNINGLLQGDPMGYAQINTNQDGVYVFSGGQLSGPVKVCEQTNQGSRPGFVDPLVLFNCDPGLPPLLVQNLNVTKHFVTYKGYKYFELNNHLGNVLTTVSDRRIGVSLSTSPLLIDHYTAVILSSSDYYAFGSSMPGRTYSSGGYRYGFNGQELDKELGEGDYDFGARIYSSRLGRFFTIDKYANSFTDYSPYVYALNSPMVVKDEGGMYAVYIHYRMVRRALLEMGIDKKIARQIARYASVYADYPTPFMQSANTMYAHIYLDFDGMEDMYMSEDEAKSWMQMENSQSDTKIRYGVCIHAMRAYWEDISVEEAVERALWGGDYIEKNGENWHIEGAFEVLNRLMESGKAIEDFSEEEKMLLGMALHTIQDSYVHQGGRWSLDDHTTNHKCQHPHIACTKGTNQEVALSDTKLILNAIQSNAQVFKNQVNSNSIPIGGSGGYKPKKFIKEKAAKQKNQIRVNSPRYKIE